MMVNSNPLPRLLGLLFTAILSILILSSTATAATVVYFADMEGIVGVPMEEHVDEVFNSIGDQSDALLIFKMNTPGGLVDSMSGIMSRMASAKYPVVVWVAPGGARAASAGAFIVQAAHVAVMAPGTNIGAAHPVSGGGGDIKDTSKEMERKIVNDLTAKMRAFAQERGRNVEEAELMVKESKSFTAREAEKLKIVDFIAESEDELLRQLDGRVTIVGGERHVISLAGHRVEQIETSTRLQVLGFISNPNIAYLALIAGVFLIILEAKAPGGFVMGATGALLLLIASYGLRVLPVNMAGLALLVGGIVMMLFDFIIGATGLLVLVGIGAMLFGGLILFKAPGGELLNVSLSFIMGVTAVLAVLFVILLWVIYKALRKKPVSGEGILIGQRVPVVGYSEGEAMVMVHGEYWRVRCIDRLETLHIGDEVQVERVQSLILYVRVVGSAVKRRKDG